MSSPRPALAAAAAVGAHLLATLPATAAAAPLASPRQEATPVADTILVTGRVSEEGTLTARIERRLLGSEIPEERELRARPHREALAKLVRATASTLGLAGSMRAVRVELPDGAADALGVSFRTTIAGWVTLGEEEARAQLPLPVPRLPLPGEEGSGPVDRGGLRHYARAEIEFPAGTDLVPPVPGQGELDVGSFRSESSMTGRTLTVEQEVVLEAGARTGERAEEYAAFLTGVRRGLGTRVFVRRRTPLYADVDSADVASGDPDALARAGLAARRDGLTGRAIELLRRAVELEPKHPSAWSWLGNAFLEAGRPREAEEALRRQLELDPGVGHTLASLGVALDRQGRAREAEELYRRQLEMRPGDPYASVGLASLLVEQGEVEEARPHLESVDGLETGDARLLLTLGWTLLHAGQAERAVPVLERVVEADSSMAAGRAHLGTALRRAGRAGEALPHLRAAVGLAPDRAEFRVDLARVLWQSDRDREALEVLAEGMSRAEGDPRTDLCQAYGHTLNRLGRASQAPSCSDGDGSS